jgi:Ser/Thr protein kinase RdoA (MazF antagonist)
MPGAADFAANPRVERVEAALRALAELHIATATFPLKGPPPHVSAALVRRQIRLQTSTPEYFDELTRVVEESPSPEMDGRARRVVAAARLAAPDVLRRVLAAGRIMIRPQPCLGDVWHGNVLFEGDRVAGIVDTTGIRPDSVALDISRLLGSMTHPGDAAWEAGLAAYHAVRPLCDPERTLVDALDRTGILLGGLNWIEWIYRQRRHFDDPAAVLSRVDWVLARLERPGVVIA